jgi:hypothetical protein
VEGVLGASSTIRIKFFADDVQRGSEKFLDVPCYLKNSTRRSKRALI